MPMSLLSPLSSIPVVFVDVETTGASPDAGHRVIELAVARFEGGLLTYEHAQLFNPDTAIPPFITELTGITPAMCEDQPRFSDVAAEMLAQLTGCVLVGHNVMFDLGFISSEFRKARLDFPSAISAHHILDTLRLARRLVAPRGNSLQNLARRLNLVIPDQAGGHVAHRALADVHTTARLFAHMLAPTGLWQMSLADVLAAQGGAFAPAAIRRPTTLPLELEEALVHRTTVELLYTDAQQRRTTRVVTPIEVRKFKGELMLVAHCSLRNERRMFAVQRIVNITRPPRLDPDSQVND
jgi:DNA polymerase III epsilon subunit family exonuclease